MRLLGITLLFGLAACEDYDAGRDDVDRDVPAGRELDETPGVTPEGDDEEAPPDVDP
ncbi:MAG: hypothetical protein ACOZNI_05570 [Myxococcota bacterium]